jgi:hypothetical protein
MKLISNSLRFDVSDAAKFRFHVLDHYYKHGIKSAAHVFNIPKSTVYDWKKVFEKSKKKINSMVLKSTRPNNVRQMSIDPELTEFIKSMRQECENISKYKIKPFLDDMQNVKDCQSMESLKSVLSLNKKTYFLWR